MARKRSIGLVWAAVGAACGGSTRPAPSAAPPAPEPSPRPTEARLLEAVAAEAQEIGQAVEAAREEAGTTRGGEDAVAIARFAVEGGRANRFSRWLHQRLLAQAAEHQPPGLTLVERARREQLDEEVDLSAEGWVDDASAQNFGEFKGASLLVVGELTRTRAGRVHATWRLVQLPGRAVVGSGTLDLDLPDEFNRMYEQTLQPESDPARERAERLVERARDAVLSQPPEAALEALVRSVEALASIGDASAREPALGELRAASLALLGRLRLEPVCAGARPLGAAGAWYRVLTGSDAVGPGVPVAFFGEDELELVETDARGWVRAPEPAVDARVALDAHPSWTVLASALERVDHPLEVPSTATALERLPVAELPPDEEVPIAVEVRVDLDTAPPDWARAIERLVPARAADALERRGLKVVPPTAGATPTAFIELEALSVRRLPTDGRPMPVHVELDVEVWSPENGLARQRVTATARPGPTAVNRAWKKISGELGSWLEADFGGRIADERLREAGRRLRLSIPGGEAKSLLHALRAHPSVVEVTPAPEGLEVRTPRPSHLAELLERGDVLVCLSSEQLASGASPRE